MLFAVSGNCDQADTKSYKKVPGIKMCCFGAKTSDGIDPVLDLYTTEEFSTVFYFRVIKSVQFTQLPVGQVAVGIMMR